MKKPKRPKQSQREMTEGLRVVKHYNLNVRVTADMMKALTRDSVARGITNSQNVRGMIIERVGK